jgi:hypothetical protein
MFLPKRRRTSAGLGPTSQKMGLFPGRQIQQSTLLMRGFYHEGEVKIVPMLKYAPRHENVWGEWSLGTRRR